MEQERGFFEKLPEEVFRLIIKECDSDWWVPKLVSVYWSEQARIAWLEEMVKKEKRCGTELESDMLHSCRRLEGTLPSWDFYRLIEGVESKYRWLTERPGKNPPMNHNCKLGQLYYIMPQPTHRIIVPVLAIENGLRSIHNGPLTLDTTVDSITFFRRPVKPVRMIDLAFDKHTTLIQGDSEYCPSNAAEVDRLAVFAYVNEEWKVQDCLDFLANVPKWKFASICLRKEIDSAMEQNREMALKRWNHFCSSSKLNSYPDLNIFLQLGLFPSLYKKISSSPDEPDLYYISFVIPSSMASVLKKLQPPRKSTVVCTRYLKRNKEGKKMLVSTFQYLFAPTIVNMPEILDPYLYEVRFTSSLDSLFAWIQSINSSVDASSSEPSSLDR